MKEFWKQTILHTYLAIKLLKWSAAFWAEFKIFRSAVPTVRAAFPRILSFMENEEIFPERGKVSFFYFATYFIGKFTGRIATAHFCKIAFVPFEKRNKKERKIRVSYKNMDVTIFLTAFANDCLIKI